MTVMDQQPNEMDRLWTLLNDLSHQLSQNRIHTDELHKKAEELKTQAIHTQTGFTLRRFNTDVSQEEFESELERLNVTLVLENQSLQQENRQLSSLLKDYEGTLEAVMGKFRAHAYATQQHHLDLVRHYESILLSIPSLSLQSPDSPSDSDDTPPIDPLHLSLSLSHIASLIRKALRSLQGEDPDDSSSSPMLFPANGSAAAAAESASAIGGGGGGGGVGVGVGGFRGESMRESLAALESHLGGGLQRTNSSSSISSSLSSTSSISSRHSERERDVTEGGYIGRSATTQPHYIPTTSTSSLVASPPRPGTMEQKRLGGANGSGNGNGFGPVDEALEREIELEQLRRENEELRRLLGISGVQEDGAGMV